jgi:glutathione S-transferase
MGDLTLVIGNKNYSSWSLRPWLALKQTGAPFREIVIPLDQPQTKAAIARHSPSGRVPVLHDDGLVIWDSLAIVEYLDEIFANAGLWPADAKARAVARAVAAEMHSGFQNLRAQMPMNIRASKPGVGHAPEVMADVARIATLWGDCRERFGRGGDFLFGRFTAADAFYAPVVTRFVTYGVSLDANAAAYVDAVLAWPAMAEWCQAARLEPWSHPRTDSA